MRCKAPVRIAHHPYSFLRTFDARVAIETQLMLDVEAGTPELDRAFDCHVIPKASWFEESRARAHERKAVEVEMLEHVEFGHAKRMLEQKCRRCIEDVEVARVKDNAGGVAVAPLDPDLARIAECGHRVMPSMGDWSSPREHASARCHTQRAVKSDHFAIEVGIVNAMQDEGGEFARFAEAFGKRHRGAQRVLHFLRQYAQHRRTKNSRRYCQHADAKLGEFP